MGLHFYQGQEFYNASDDVSIGGNEKRNIGVACMLVGKSEVYLSQEFRSASDDVSIYTYSWK